MTNDNNKPLRGEIMPPQEHSAPAVASGHDLSGPALFVKWRHEAAKKKIEAFTSYLKAHTGAVNARAELDQALNNAFEDRARALQRWKNLDDELEIQNLEVKGRLLDMQQQAALKEAAHRENLAVLKARALMAERRLEKLEKKEDSHPDSSGTPEERAMARVKAFRKQKLVMIADFIEECGGEDKLTEDDRETIRKAELALHDRINREFEALREQ